jgi:predicted RNase H-like HicB family nuclease
MAIRTKGGEKPEAVSRQPIKLKVIFHPEKDGYSVAFPALPGCFSQGDTLEEARANIKEAIAGWLEAAAGQHTSWPDDPSPEDFAEEIDL